MKHVSTSIVLFAALALGWIGLRAAQPDYAAPGEGSGVPRALPVAQPAGHVARGFAVEGMCCSGCSSKLYRRLVGVAGVASAAIDFDAGQAWALVAVGTDDAALVTALTFDKYSAAPLP